jgi:hypothetical protein
MGIVNEYVLTVCGGMILGWATAALSIWYGVSVATALHKRRPPPLPFPLRTPEDEPASLKRPSDKLKQDADRLQL